MKSAFKRVGLVLAGMLLWSLLYNGYWHLRFALETEPETGCTTYVCEA